MTTLFCHAKPSGRQLSQGERETLLRGSRLRAAFDSAAALAEYMHQNYRAAFKALHEVDPLTGGLCRDEHDHGWERCQSKEYFLKRAKRQMEGRA